MKITEDVYQLVIPMKRNPLGKTYSYLLKKSKTLIDTGIPTQYAYDGLTKELELHGFKPKNIERVFLTHLHSDHIGLVNTLVEDGAEVWASEKAAKRLEQSVKQWNKMYQLVRDETRRFGGEKFLDFIRSNKYAFRRKREPLNIDQKIKDGENININGAKLKAIWTPGHAPEHMVYYNIEKKALFSGDHVLPKITSHISLHSYEDLDPLGDYLDSLTKIEDLDVNIVLPAHEWTFKNLKERIKELRIHHTKRLQEMKNALIGKEKTVYGIGRNVHWDSRPWNDMDFWTKRMAATETYAHLVYLKNRNKIQEIKRNGVLYYSLK
jgi:glyoxylase-like metal-dependent hydrolase (beta-lactamase superfamily II)